LSGIYIHIPFCRRKCTYCDFYLVTNLNIVDKFISNLLKEIELTAPLYNNEKYDTIFFGGGTPSLLPPDKLEEIITALKNNYTISDNCEITIEANPEDFFEADFNQYKAAGINRFSFGVQSFIDEELKFLTRMHTANQAENVIRECRKVFDNVSCDIIYSLPEQTKENLKYSLDKIIELNIPHVSAYTLIFEEQTKLYTLLQKNLVVQNQDSVESDLYSYVSDFLIENGFNHYEVSNYAKSGYQSKHNLKYWSYENYIGLGPSAHSLHNGKRWNNFRDIIKYNIYLQDEKLPIENEIILDKKMMKMEFIMLALRSAGVNYERYDKLFNMNFADEYKNSISELAMNGLGKISDINFKLTEKGYKLTDEIVAKYF
jgi:oxygen-independent coproporphyrinogen-3 oxidase